MSSRHSHRHHSRSHASPSMAERRPFPAWLIFILGMIVGGFAMMMLRPADGNGSNNARNYSNPQSSTPAARKSESVAAPVFEFYDRLKKEQVDVPDYKPSAEQFAAQQTHEYFLQVASFRKQDDADKVRAQLILLNMEAGIETSRMESGDKRYRVIAGPYRSKSKLAKAQQLLVSNRYEYLKLKREIQR